MQEERDVEQPGEDEEVEAHRRRGGLEESAESAADTDDDEVEAHRMFQSSPEEPGKRF